MLKRINFRMLLAQYVGGLLTFLVLFWMGNEHAWAYSWLSSCVFIPFGWVVIESVKKVLSDETNGND